MEISDRDGHRDELGERQLGVMSAAESGAHFDRPGAGPHKAVLWVLAGVVFFFYVLTQAYARVPPDSPSPVTTEPARGVSVPAAGRLPVEHGPARGDVQAAQARLDVLQARLARIARERVADEWLAQASARSAVAPGRMVSSRQAQCRQLDEQMRTLDTVSLLPHAGFAQDLLRAGTNRAHTAPFRFHC